MRDYVELGSSPAEEDCVQLGSDDYYLRSRVECAIWAAQLRRAFSNMPDGIKLGIKGFNHDFGTYHEVVAYFDDSDEEASDFAWKMQDDAPAHWDEEALQDIKDSNA